MAHVGVLRVLEAAQIRVDIVAGTSAGAIVGALYAGGKSADEIQRLARDLSFRKWFARDSSGLGLFSTNGIRRVIDSALGEDAHIEDLPKKFACIAVDLDSQKQIVFDSGLVADAVCASAAYPGLYAPVRLGDRYLFDGGVLNPVPFDVARQLGADRVIASDLGAQEPFFASLNEFDVRKAGVLWQLFYAVSHQQVFRVIERSIGIMSQEIRNHKFAESPPDVIIFPRVDSIGLLDFGLMDACCDAGESAARELLPEIIRVTREPEARRQWRQWLARFRAGVWPRRAKGF